MNNFRKYGQPPFSVILLHGGPGAAGELAAVAKKLSSKLGVIELLQTGFCIEELIEESYQVIMEHAQIPVILAGHSWGAWLGILFNEKHPDLVRKLILVSSGPFESLYAKHIMSTRMDRISPDDAMILNGLLNQLSESKAGKNDIFKKIGHILDIADIYKPIEYNPLDIEYNYEIFEAIWPSAANLRDSGELLSIASNITCPVVAIHGDYDPHPAEGVEKPLAENLRDFRFILLEKCGHYPWKEQHGIRQFYKILSDEMML